MHRPLLVPTGLEAGRSYANGMQFAGGILAAASLSATDPTQAAGNDLWFEAQTGA